MSVIALTSASGSPGVTTTAIGLTLAWHRSVIMVDADPGAYQAVLAGYLRGQLPTGKGLQRVAEAHRDGRSLAEVVSDETVPLADLPLGPEESDEDAELARAAEKSSGPSRRLLPGFIRPANAALFGPVWPDLVDAFTGFDEAGIDVIVDLGRMDRQGLPQPLLDRADLVVLLLRTSLRAIAAARGYAAMLREQSRLSGADTNIGLGLVGENQPYGRREIAKLLNLPVVTALADDPDSASTFSDGIRRHRRFDRAALPRSLRNAVDDVTGQIRRRRARLGLDESAPPVAPPRESVPGQGGDVAQVSDSARTTAVGSGVAAEVGDRMPAGTGGDPRG